MAKNDSRQDRLIDRSEMAHISKPNRARHRQKKIKMRKVR